MAYVRKTKNQQELSEACRRAALSRRTNRGGRPRLPENDVPSRTIKVAGRDFDILKAFADEGEISLRDAFHKMMAVIVLGGQIKARSGLRPSGWKYKFAKCAAA